MSPLRYLLPGFLLSVPLAAQELLWTDGVIGSSVDYHLDGDTGEPWLLGLSFNAGPTPIALLDASDPRVLSIGIDHLNVWTSGVLPAGVHVQSYPLLLDASAVGLPLHAQFLTLFGPTTLIDDISNPVSFVLQTPGSVVSTLGGRTGFAKGDTASVLLDGRVFLAGGVDDSGGSEVLLARAERFDPMTQTFAACAATLGAARTSHTSSVLQDGRVLLVGGRGTAGALASVEIYDPVSDTLSAAAVLSSARSQHTATVLSDGRVLVVGGVSIDDPADPFATLVSAPTSTEVYDPAVNAWNAGPDLPTGLIGHAAVLLGDGRVLISGGIELTSLFGFPSQKWTANCHLADPVAGTLSAAAPLPSPRANHAAIVPQSDGRALAIGGETIVPFLLSVFIDEVVRYEHTSDTWVSRAPLSNARGYHDVCETTNSIVVVGGVSDIDTSLGITTPAATVEIAPPDASSWGAPIPMHFGRTTVRAVALNDGLRVLVTGAGPDSLITPDPSAELVLP